MSIATEPCLWIDSDSEYGPTSVSVPRLKASYDQDPAQTTQQDPPPQALWAARFARDIHVSLARVARIGDHKERPLSRPLIALDADGVLLDYNLGYAAAWERAFGVRPRERDPQAYWAIDRWEVTRLSGAPLDRFRAAFDEQFWSSLPAIPGALKACHALHDAGYDLVCVSALAAHHADARLQNLHALEFPIERVIATGSVAADRSPKADALAALRPVAFVDDNLPYLMGVPDSIHTALVQRATNGSPNVSEALALARSSHADLAGFADWWLSPVPR